MRNLGTAELSVSGSEYLMWLEPKCQPGVQSSDLGSSRCVRVHKVAYVMAAGFPQSELWGEGGSGGAIATKMDATVSFISSSQRQQSNTSAIFNWSHRSSLVEHGRKRHKGVNIRKQGSLGAILESGYHTSFVSFIIFSHLHQSLFCSYTLTTSFLLALPYFGSRYSEVSLRYLLGEKNPTKNPF